MDNIILGQYLPNNSFIHRLNPITKIGIYLLYMVCVFIAKQYQTYLLVFVLLLGMILISKVSFEVIFRSLKTIILVLICTSLINLFLVQGESGTEVFSFGFLKIYLEGIKVAITIVIRLILLISGSFILTLTTSPTELTSGIEVLLKPMGKKVSHNLTMMITIGLRFIPTLMEECTKIMNAQKARGADFDSGGVIKRIKAMVPLVVPLFLNSLQRADELALAMEARGYRGEVGRSKMKVLKFAFRDIVTVTIWVFILGLNVYLRIEL